MIGVQVHECCCPAALGWLFFGVGVRNARHTQIKYQLHNAARKAAGVNGISVDKEVGLVNPSNPTQTLALDLVFTGFGEYIWSRRSGVISMSRSAYRFMRAACATLRSIVTMSSTTNT